jgi:hypothetical protein
MLRASEIVKMRIHPCSGSRSVHAMHERVFFCERDWSAQVPTRMERRSGALMAHMTEW